MNLHGIKNRIDTLKERSGHGVDHVTEIHRIIVKPAPQNPDGSMPEVRAIPTGEVIVHKIKPWWNDK